MSWLNADAQTSKRKVASAVVRTLVVSDALTGFIWAGPESGEVRINVAINGKITAGLEDKTVGGGTEQVATDGFDGEGMGLLWSVREAGALMNGEGNVGARVVAKIEKHADD